MKLFLKIYLLKKKILVPLNKAFKGENDDIDQNDTGYNEELRSFFF